MANTEDANAAYIVWAEMTVTHFGVVEWFDGPGVTRASGSRKAGGGATEGAVTVPVLRINGPIKGGVERFVYKAKPKREAEAMPITPANPYFETQKVGA